METLATFLPIDRRHALVNNQPMPDRVQGAVLFADISGFTPLTAVLAKELGPQRGAEKLSHLLNQVYTSLIAQVHQHKGSVITFSGDSITCWFDQSLADSCHPAQLALACALELQRVMGGLDAVTTANGDTIILGLKVAVASGPARRFLVGDPHAYVMEVLAGATLDRVAAAETEAQRGEVIVTADVLNHLDNPPLITGWRTSAAGQRGAAGQQFAIISALTQPVTTVAMPPIPSIASEVARNWLLPPIYSRLQQSSSDFLAELRPAIALFLKFSGIDYDGDDNAGEKLDIFVRQAQAILNHYQGFLLQITMGDKGSYLYIAFGAPLAHEDDAARAAAAALELGKLAQKLEFLRASQIGIASGLAYSSDYGSPNRRTYGVLGNHVNIAARLMMTARPGQILVSTAVTDAIDNEFELSALPPVQLKGIREPLPLWELRGRRLTPRSTLTGRVLAPLVGREDERKLMGDLLTRLAHGRSANLLIEGPAGIGKSRLLQELLNMATADTAVTFVGSGDAVEMSTPYHAWRTIFERILAFKTVPHESGPDPAWCEEMVASLDPAIKHLAPLLNAVLPLELPDTELTAQMGGEARQENSHQLLVHLLQTAVAGRPVVLAIEDAHWLDSVSWTLLRRVQREVQPLLLVIATRPFSAHAPAFYTDLIEMAATHIVRLDMLPQAAIDELICRHLGVRRLPTAVTRLIHDKAEGHPFFSEEIAYALRDRGLIKITNGECHLAANNVDFNNLDFPNTIQSVITSRIDILSPSEQLTIKVASVIGRTFPFHLLHDIYPDISATAQIPQNLATLERLDISPLETPEPNLAYIFKHIVTQEVVYSLMTFAQRQQLHRKTAVWYEQNQKSNLSHHYPLLAHHWREANQKHEAIAYYEKAGENAFRAYANQEAIRFFTQAVELSDESHGAFQRARWQRRLGEATYRLSLVEKSLSHYQSALSLLKQPIPASSARRVWGLVVELVRQWGHRRQPARYMGQVTADHDRTALLEIARSYESVSEIYYNTGDFLTSFYSVMRAFNLAEKAGVSPELARGYANMCATLGTISFHSGAESYRTRALAMAEEIDDLPAKAWVQIPLSTYSLWIGAWDRAEQQIGCALEIYSQLGDWRRWCVAAWVSPQVAQGKGELVRAQDLWAELYTVARRSQDTRHQVRSQGGQMFNYLSLGQQEQAFACVDTVAMILEENPQILPLEERLWYGIQAMRALHQGQWVEARELAHKQLTAVVHGRFKFDLLELFAAAAEIFLTLWEREEASAKEAKRGCAALNQYARNYSFARPRALRCQGRYAWLSGKKRQAQKLWRSSLAQAKLLDMRYEQALTLYEMGRCLSQDSEANLAQAQALLSDIGVAELSFTAVARD